MALLVMLSLNFTSCKQDTQPRLNTPTEFVLNTPPMANNTYVLTEGDQFELTCSQPNYGLGTVTNYEVQVSLTEDFEEYQALPAPDTQAKVMVSDQDFATAICSLMGAVDLDTADLFDPSERDVWVRLRAFVNNCDYSSIDSNIIKLSVIPYFAIPIPGQIWIVGDVNGWAINDSKMTITEEENGIDSKIYTGVWNFTAEQAANGFRFYEALGDWGENGAKPSIGANPDNDDNAQISVDGNGVYSGACVYGKGNWCITNWPGGDMKITVDLNNMTVQFEKVD